MMRCNSRGVIVVGTPRLLQEQGLTIPAEANAILDRLVASGQTPLLVACDGNVIGVIGALFSALAALLLSALGGCLAVTRLQPSLVVTVTGPEGATAARLEVTVALASGRRAFPDGRWGRDTLAEAWRSA